MVFPSWLKSARQVQRNAGKAQRGKQARQDARKSPLLWLEQLEDRTLMSVFQWTGTSTASANWSDASNWAQNGVTATSYPQTVGDVAQFTGTITGTTTVQLTSNITVGELDFATSSNISINTLNKSVLIFSKGSGASGVLATLPGNTGTDTIFAPIQEVGAGVTLAANISAGTLLLNNSGAALNTIPSSSSFNVNGGILNVQSPNNTDAAAVIVNSGQLLVNGNGTMDNSAALTVATGGTITVDDSVPGTSNSNRIGANTGIVLNGGTFSFIGANNAPSSATVGTITVNKGSSTVLTTSGSGSGSVVLTAANLVRNTGATVTFQGNASNTGTQNLDTPNNRIALTTVPTLGGNNGGILPYAMVINNSFGDFATYDSINSSIAAFSGYATSIGAAGPLDIVKESTPETLVGNKTIYALLLSAGGSVGEAGNTLTITSGGIINAASSTTSLPTLFQGGTISGGTLAFGGTGEGIITTATVGGVTANFYNLGFTSNTTPAPNVNFNQVPVATRIDLGFDYAGASAAQGLGGAIPGGLPYSTPATVLPPPDAQANNMAGTWTGSLNVVTGGIYTFSELASGFYMFVDGFEVYSNGGNGATSNGVGNTSLPLVLTAGLHSLKVNFQYGSGGSAFILSYTGPDTGGGPVCLAAAAGPGKPGLLTTATTTISSTIAGNGGLTIGGPGSVILPAGNTNTGTTTLAGGTLTVGVNSSLGTGPLALVAGTLQANAAVTLANPLVLSDSQVTIGGVNNINFSGGGTLADTGLLSNTLTDINQGQTNISGVLSGTGSLTIASGNLGGSAPYQGFLPQVGNLILSGASTYSGGTTLVNGASVVVAASSTGTTSGPFGTGTLNLVNGTLLSDASLRTLSNPVVLAGTATLSSSSFGGTSVSTGSFNFTGSFNVSTASTLTVQGGSATLPEATISGNLTGTNQLTVSGLGFLALSGSNSAFTGGLVLNAGSLGGFGTLIVGSSGALGAGPVTLSEGALQAGSTGLTVANLLTFTDGSYVAFTGANPLTFTNASASGNNLAGTVNFIVNAPTTFNEILGGTGPTGGNLNLFSGTSTLTMTGADSYTGATVVNGATLVLTGANGALSGTSTVTINAGATLSLLNVAGGNSNARLASGVLVTINGGTFSLTGAPGTASTQTVGGITAASGNSTILTTAGTGSGSSVNLAGGSLAVTSGATINFQAGTGQTIGSAANQIGFTSVPSAGNVIQGATVTDSTTFPGNTSGYNLAISGASGVAALTSYVPLSPSGANLATDNVLVTTSTALTASDQVNAVLLVGSGINLSGSAGTTLTVNGGIVAANAATATGTDTISVPFLGFGMTTGNLFTNNGTLMVSSNITGSGGLTISGPGTLTLPSANSYTASSAQPAQQTLQIMGAPTGGTYALSFNGASTGGISYTATNVTITTDLQNLTTIGPGNVNVTGTYPFFTVAFAGALAGSTQQPLQLANNSLAGGMSPTVLITVTNPGSPTTFLDGPGILNLGTNGAVQGGLTVTNGTIESTSAVSLSNGVSLGSSAAIGAAASGVLTIGGSNPVVIGNSVTLNGLTGQINVTNTAASVISAAISGGTTTTLVKQGVGTLTLSGINTYAGATLIQQGALNIQNNAALGTTGNAVQTLTLDGTVVSGSFTLGFNNATSIPITFPQLLVTNNGTPPNTAQLALNIQTALDLLPTVGLNNTAVTVTGTQTTAAPITTTYVATITFQNQLGAANVPLLVANSANLIGDPVAVAQTLAGSASGTVVSAGAQLQLQGGLSNVAEQFTIGGSGVGGLGALLNITGNNTLTSGITLSSSTTVGGDVGTVQLGGNITGAADLTKVGGGSYAFNVLSVAGTTITVNNNSFTGQTNINAGVVQSNTPTGLGSNAGGTVVANGAELILGVASTISITGGPNTAVRGKVGIVAGEALTVSGTGVGLMNSDVLEVSGALQDNCASSVAWTGPMTLVGNTTIANTVNQGAITTPILPGAQLYITGSIGGTGNLTLVGAGGIQFEDANTYSGTTTVTVGTLTLAGAGTLTQASGVSAVQIITLGGTVTGGSFTLAFNGGTTGPIAWSSVGTALAGNIQTALNTLSTIGAGNTVVTGTGPFTVTFLNFLGNTNVPFLTAASSLAGTGATVAVVGAVQTITLGGTVTGGSFTLTYSGATTTAINFSSVGSVLAGNIQSALAGLSNIGAGNTTVTGTGPFTVNFLVYPGITNVSALTFTSSLTGTNPTLAISNLPSVVGVASITVRVGASLTFDNTGSNIANRVPATDTIALNGSTLSYLGSNAAGAASTQSLGVITLSTGYSTILIQNGTGTGSTAVVTSAGLFRTTGATVNFTGETSNLGGSTNQLLFTTPPVLVGASGTSSDSIIPYAVVQGPGNPAPTVDMATYGAFGVAPFANYVTSLATAGPTSNVKLTTNSALSANVKVNSLLIVGNVTLAGNGGAGNFTISVGSGAVVETATGGAVGAINGGTLDFGSAEGILTATSSLFSTGTTFTGGLTIGSSITGTSGLTISGPGTVTLNGTGVYTGLTTYNGGPGQAVSLLGAATGSLILGNVAAIGNTTLEAIGGIFGPSYGGNFSVFANPVILNNSVVSLGISGARPSYAGPITLIGNNSIDAQITVYMAGAIGGPGSLTIGNNGPAGSVTAVVLEGNNTFTGGTNLALSAGCELVVTNDNAFGTGPINWLSGAIDTTRSLNQQTVESAVGSIIINNPINLANSSPYVYGPATAAGSSVTLTGAISVIGTNAFGAGLTLNGTAGNQNVTLSGVISGPGSVAFQVSAASTLTVTGNNTFTGGASLTNTTASNNPGSATVAGGPVILGNSNALGSGPFSLLVGTLQDDGIHTLTIPNQLLIDSISTTVTRTISATSASNPLTFTGLVTAGPNLAASTVGGFTKSGVGNLVFTNPIVLTNSVTVSQGSMTLTGSGTLSAAGVPGGTGTVPNPGLILNPGGTLVVDNTGTYNANRLSDFMPIGLSGGTLDYRGSNVAGSLSTETIGQVLLNAGSSAISTTVEAGGGAAVILSSSNLTRSAGGILNFIGAGPTAATATLGSATNQIIFTGAIQTLVQGVLTSAPPAIVTGGNLLPFATVTTTVTGATPSSTFNFASAPSAAPFSIAPFTTYTTAGLSAASSSDVVKLTASDALAGGGNAAAVLIVGDNINVGSGGGTLNVQTGMIAVTGANTTGDTISGPVSFMGEGMVISNSSPGLTIGGALTAADGLTTGGTGTVTLSAANNPTATTGSVTLTGGTLVVNNGGALGGGNVIDLVVTAGTLQAGTSGGLTGITLTNPIVLTTGNGALTFGGANPLTLSDTISGIGGNVIVNNTNSLTYAGTTANTYSGTTTVNAGILLLAKVPNSGTSLNAFAGPLVINGGTVQVTTNFNQLNSENVTITATNAVQTLNFTGTPTGGTFTLAFGSPAQTTGLITYSSVAATLQSNIQNALNALNTIGGGSSTVVVSGSPASSAAISFIGALAGAFQPTMTVPTNSLAGGSTPNVTVAVTTVGASGTLSLAGSIGTINSLTFINGGTVTMANGATPGALTIAPSNIVTESTNGAPSTANIIGGSLTLATTTASFETNFITSVSGNVQSISFPGAPTGGTFTLTFNGAPTTAIVYSTVASTLQSNIQSALGAIASIGAANVSVSAVSATSVLVTFVGNLASATQNLLTSNSLLTGGTSSTVAIGDGTVQANPVQTVTLTGVTSGTFTLAFAGTTTSPIVYSSVASALASNIQTALNALTSIGTGGTSVSVSGTVATVTFSSAPGVVLPALTAAITPTSNTVETVTLPTPTGGQFTLALGTTSTQPITYSSTTATLASNIQNALIAALGAGTVSVTAANPTTATVTFQGTLANGATTATLSSNGAATSARQTITFTGITGGTFELTFSGATTTPIAFVTTTATLASNIQAALDALSTIGAANTAVSDSFTSSSTTSTVTINFQNSLASTAQPTFTVIGAPAVATVQTITFPAGATGGAFALTLNGLTTAPISYSATAATLGSNIQNALNTTLGSGTTTVSAVSATSVTVTFAGSLAAGMVQVPGTANGVTTNAVQNISLPAPATGTFTLTFNGAITAPINYSTAATALGSNIQAALTTLLGPGTTLVSAVSPTSVNVTFTGTLGAAPQPLMTSNGAAINAQQTINFNATPAGSTFTLTFGGATTTAISYSSVSGALQANVQSALDALSTLGAGKTLALANSAGTSVVVAFIGSLASSPQTPITASGTGVTVNATTVVGQLGLLGGTSQTLTITATTAGVPGLAPAASQAISVATTTTGFGLTGGTSPTTSVTTIPGFGGLLGGTSTTITTATTTQGFGVLGTTPSVTTAIKTPGFGGDLIVSAAIGGAGGISKIGSGTLTFSGTTANSYTGVSNIFDGTLLLAKQQSVSAIAAPLVISDFNRVAAVRIISNFSGQLTNVPTYVNAYGTLDMGTASTASQAIASLDIKGGTVLTGSNTLTLGGAVTAVAIGNLSGTLSGKLDLGTSSQTFSVLDNGAVPGLNLAAVVSSAAGAFGITKLGAGTLVLSGTAANTYTGPTLVNEGTLLLNDSKGVAVPGPLTVGDGVGGSGTNKVDVLRLGTSNQIASTVSVTVNNSGLLDLNGFNNTIAASASSAFTMSGGTVNTEAGTLTLAGNISGQQSVSNITPATINGNLALSTGARQFDVQQGNVLVNGVLQPDMVINAVISGAGGLTKVGDVGTLQLNAINTYTGGTVVGQGPLTVDGTLVNSVQTISITGSPTGGSFTLTLNGSTASVNYSSVASTLQTSIQNALNGLANILPGNSLVNAASSSSISVIFIGTLAAIPQNTMTASGAGLTGGTSPSVSVSSAPTSITVTSGGVLGGNATTSPATAGPVVATTGGVLNPGDPVTSTGISSITSAIGTASTVDLSGGGNVTMEISSLPGVAGVAFDQLKVGGLGILKLGGTSSLTLDLAGLKSAGTATAAILYNGLEGTFSGVTLLNNSLNLAPVLTYNAPSSTNGFAFELNIGLAAPATHFSITTSLSSVNAGAPTNVTVTALDQFNNTALTYTGTVHFSKTDTNLGSVLPSDYTFTSGNGTSFDNGVHVFTGVKLVTVGSQTITATDTTTAGITSGITGNIALNVIAGTAQNFGITAASPVAAGQFVVFTVTARDQFNNPVSAYAGTVHFTSSDPQAGLASDSTLTNGVGFFAATLKSAGTPQTITGTDAVNGISGISNSIIVNPGAVSRFAVTAPTSPALGTPFNVTVLAQDAFGNTVTNYAGTVHLTSSDPNATLGGNSTLSSGKGVFSVTLQAAGNPTVTATDAANNGITGTFTFNISVATATKFLITVPSSTIAGTGFVITVAAKDPFGNTATSYAGTVHFSSSDTQAGLPGDATLTAGVGFFSVTLKTAGPQTITASDAANGITTMSGSVSVIGLAANHLALTVPAPAKEITGVPFQVTVSAVDPFGNTFTSYAGTVHFTSTDAAASLPGNVTLTNGMGNFSVTLNTPGSQTISANDTTNGNIFGTSNILATLGLVVTSLTPTSTGFIATFNKPFNPSQINLYDSLSTYGPDDVLLTGPGSTQTSFHGSLIIDPSNQTITFVKTSTFTSSVNTFNPTTGVLTAGTYTVTFRSATNGFVDLLGAPLDGTSSGNPAGSNFTTTFVVAATPTEVVGIPSFARGPNSAQTINLPNNLTFGIPINLSNGNGVTAGKFTLQYNSALLSITGVTVNTGLTNATLTLDSASTAGSAVIDFSSTTALTAGVVRLGGLVATVPNSAAPLYTDKALLHWSSLSINGSSSAVTGDDVVEVNAYFGDAAGTGPLSGEDASLISRVATGLDNNPALGILGGFAAFRLADPVLIGDLTSGGAVGAGAVTLMNSFLSGTPRPQIPTIPTGLTIPMNGVDPALSIPTDLHATAGGTVVVPVQIDSARPQGSTGVTQAILAVQYDPAEFTVSAQDVQLGALPLSGSGWQLQTAINSQTGQIGIDLFSTTPLQTSAGGTLVTIELQVRANAPAGSTGLNLVPSVNPTGSRPFVTTVSDAQGGMLLHTAQTALGTMPGAPGSVTVAPDPFVVGQFIARAPTDQLTVSNEQLALNTKNDSSSALSTVHSPLSSAFAMEPLMLAQENTLGQPGVILNSSLADQTEIGTKEQSLLQLGTAQHDWVPDDLAAYLGQTAKAGRRSPLGSILDGGAEDQENAELAGVEEFFAQEAKY